MSQQKRMSVRDAFKGLFALNKNKSRSGTSTPISTEEEEQVTISGPVGFQRHVHVGVGEDGEIVGIDNLLGYIAKTDKLEKASWDKLQSQQKELNELTDQKEEEEIKDENMKSPSEKKEEKNFKNKNIEMIKTNSQKENKKLGSNESVSNLIPIVPKSSTSSSFTTIKKNEQTLPQERENEKEEEGEDKTKKFICKYKDEEERKEHNRPLLIGNPLKVHFTTQKAIEKGIIVELKTEKDLNSLEVLLLYYLSTKTFVVEILSEKIPINK